jgi:hypothetical protein
MPEMTQPTFDFNAFLDAGKKAMAPAVKFSELSLNGFERIARQQYAFAGEVLEYSLKQMQLASTVRRARDPAFAGPDQVLLGAPGPADEVVRPDRV